MLWGEGGVGLSVFPESSGASLVSPSSTHPEAERLLLKEVSEYLGLDGYVSLYFILCPL